MFTRKSLIVGLVLLLSVIGAGSAGAFASSITPPPAPQNAWNAFPVGGISAIPVDDTDNLLTAQQVLQYLNTQGFIGGPVANGQAPTVQEVGLTDPSLLRSVLNLVIPGISPTEPVYYTQLHGPFTLSPNLSDTLLSTLLPTSNCLVALTSTPLLGQLPTLSDLPLLSDLTRGTEINGAQLSNLPILASGNLFNDLLGPNTLINGVPAANIVTVPTTAVASAPPATLANGLLNDVYEIFDAHTGNLLAWG
jgi:hypothetical protein